MYNNFTRKIIVVLAVVAFVGFGSYAFADRGGGYGQGGYGYQGYGMDYGRHGYGMGSGMGHMGYGMGSGMGHMGYGMGYGMGHMGDGHRGYRDDYRQDRVYEGDLPRDEIRQLEEAHEAFYKDTEKLRDDLYDKEVDLSRELDGENPDKQKAATLQKEISKLRSKLDQKRINHLIETRKIAPNAGRGWMRDYGSRGGDCRR